MNRARVVIHAAVSLDGRTDGFVADAAALHRLAATWPDARIIDGGDPLAAELVGQGLVDEVSLLVHPVIAGEGHASWAGGARLPADVRLMRRSAESIPADPFAATAGPGGTGTALAWLRFEAHRP